MRWETRHNAHPEDARGYDSERLAREFLQGDVFIPDEISLTYTHADRMVFGGAMPVTGMLALTSGEALRAGSFLERRELGVINIGGAGSIAVDGVEYLLPPRHGLYVGRGAQRVEFTSADAADPGRFYLASAPAHRACPTRPISPEQALPAHLGSAGESNARTIYKYVHPSVLETCQLSMGLTALESGSVWNSMPCHTHARRMEVYFYFALKPDAAVFHMMGEPAETRHIVVRDGQAVISPSWSIHCGCGTSSYSFIWAMAGENRDFDDMDAVPTAQLR